MCENNTNAIVENKEVTTPIYSSKFWSTKELLLDFHSISYREIKIRLLFFLLCYSPLQFGINLYFGYYDVAIVFAVLAPAIMLYRYLSTNKSINNAYEQRRIATGKESILNHYELFEDKIVLHIEGQNRECFYHQITKFYETTNFISLHIQHHLYLPIEKTSLNASVDEVKAFLMNKCTLVKKKTFINCADDKKLSLVLLIALILVSIIGIKVAYDLKLNDLYYRLIYMD